MSRRYHIRAKPVKAWCLSHQGVIWPAYCHSSKSMAREEAVNQNPDHRTWAAMYAAGYRLIQVSIKEVRRG